MTWFRSNTIYVSVSLFFLPVLVLCTIICLPFITFAVVALYLNAWYTYYQQAQTDAEFNLPYNPSRIIKINLIKLSHLIAWIEYTPKIVSFLYWRYWLLGSNRFREIVSENVPYYGNNTLDIYHPNKRRDGQLSKIIIFVHGGSWDSGSKMLYTTMGNTLRELGYIVIIPDYRKYPEVKIDEMYKDIREAIKWTFKHTADINGDPEQIFVMGHSAGAHLAARVVLADIIEQVKYGESLLLKASTPPRVSEKHDPAMKKIETLNERHMMENSHDFLPLVEGLLLFAGVYDISSHLIRETSRGIEKISAMSRVMGSTEEGFAKNSPIRLIERNGELFSESDDLLDLWPRILLLHGQKDDIVGMDQSANMFNTLGKLFPPERRQEVDVRMRLYKRMGHGEPVTSLMMNLFSKQAEQKLLLRDIQEFIDTPQNDEL